MSLQLKGVDPETGYESEASFDFLMLVKKHLQTRAMIDEWLKSLED